ncbi:unnamed protein product [Rangifer tarandus platyrhynchus]|uniref:Uncharacterized protein n=1 Tax=Rangifer tarandus platyrhynchus TaxID=3082113 RepID=A0AC59YA63_RANTA
MDQQWCPAVGTLLVSIPRKRCSDFAGVLVAMAVPERGSGAQEPGGARLDLGTCFARETQQRSSPAMLRSLAWVPLQSPAV